MQRIIAHLDMDAFFAAIEERDNSRFQGRPLVVGADPQGGKGRGVVSTANYKAREYGIRSAMPISTAWRLAEAGKKNGGQETIFLDVRMEKYADESRRIMELIGEKMSRAGLKGENISEQASVDEMYLDLSGLQAFEGAESFARELKEAIKRERRLTASVGLGPNKLIAKIASDMRKPDGLTTVRPEKAEAFLELLPIRKIPGIGPKTEAIFRSRGAETVRDLKRYPKGELGELLGKWGEELYGKLRGIDDTPLVSEWIPKSVGAHETFGQDVKDATILLGELKRLSERVFERFLKEGFKAYRTVVLTVRFSDFRTKNRSLTLPEPAKDVRTIEYEAMKLLLPFLDSRENPNDLPIRLLGVRVEKLE